MFYRFFICLIISSFTCLNASAGVVITNEILKTEYIKSPPNKERCKYYESADNMTDKKNRCICRQTLSYPVISYLGSRIKDSQLKEINEIIKIKAQTYDTCKEKYILGNYNLNYEIYQDSSNYLTINFIFDSYTGGAHANYSNSTLTIDLNSVKLVTLEDIINKPHSKINNYIFNKLKKDSNSIYYNNPSLTNDSKDNIIKDFTRQAFYIDNNIVTLIFPPYEVADFASGFVKIRLPKEFIKK